MPGVSHFVLIVFDLIKVGFAGELLPFRPKVTKVDWFEPFVVFLLVTRLVRLWPFRVP